MNRQDIQPGEIDKIGTKLIASLRLGENEIEKIAESPFLYSGVKARIGVGVSTKGQAFGFGRRLALGFGSLLIVAGLAVAVMFVLRSGISETAERIMPQQQPGQPVRDSNPTEADVVSVPGVLMSPQKSSSQVQNASYRRPDKRGIPVRKALTERQPEIKFYPLTFAGDPAENTSGGRVLQVEMSRSSLFAMGFNIPIENGAELVKADLLVGQDGVPRAIRLH